MGFLFNEITKAYDLLNQNETSARLALAIEIKNVIKGELGFDPTIRNVVDVFTSAVEVFMETIFEVSKAAQLNSDRNSLLDGVFNNDGFDSDYRKGSKEYYPWPDYREKDGIGGYVEKYLGSASVLVGRDISVINELVFIDDLLNAFIKRGQQSDIDENALDAQYKNWIPINPLDTRVFTKLTPYERIEGKNVNEVMGLMLTRAVTFLGLTNNSLTDEEIISMANHEVISMLANLKDNNVKEAISKLDSETILKTKVIIGGSTNALLGGPTKLLTKNISGDYRYDFIVGSDNTFKRVEPISDSFFNVWKTTDEELLKKK